MPGGHPADGAAGAAAPPRASSSTTTACARIAAKNRVCRSYIGLGYHDTITPRRHPAQRVRESRLVHAVHAVSGRDRAGPPRVAPQLPDDGERPDGDGVANASLLDEATAAAEAMALLLRVHKRRGRDDVPRVGPGVSAGARRHARRARRRWASRCASRTSTTRRRRAGRVRRLRAVARRPRRGASTCRALIERAHAAGALVAVGTDLLALALVTPPGEAGADVVVGNAQRFGVPLGYGGPHAAFFADARARSCGRRPGRIIGVSVDSARPPRVSHGAADARAAHPPREGDVEHLHGAGAARQHGGVLRGVSRPGRAPRTSPRACTTRRSRLAAAAGRAGLAADERARTSTRCASRRRRRRSTRCAAPRRRAASTSGIRRRAWFRSR